MNYVYVLSPDGEPLMPTTRYGKVRRMLKSGQAVPVTTVPFTIRLAYFPQTSVCQQVTAGFDPGRTKSLPSASLPVWDSVIILMRN